jgi:hypothetical protein
MRKKTVDGLRDALSALVTAVPQEFTEAVAAQWAAQGRRQAADAQLDDAMSGPNRKLRQFLLRYFKLRSGESIDVNIRQWWVNYDKSRHGGKEFVTPHVAFSIRVGHGVRVEVDCAPHQTCTDPDKRVWVMLNAVERAKRMVEAARG